MKKWLLRLLGVFCLLLFFGYIYVYETHLHGQFNQSDVVIALGHIPQNAIIQEENLALTSYPNELITQDTIQDKHQLVGLRTTQPINKNDTFTIEKTEPHFLKKTDEHRYFSIPQSWIQSVPGSLRRMDEVDVWLTPHQNHIELDFIVQHEPYLQGIIVAFIKNSSNTEVVGALEPSDRLDAESRPALLELSLTNEQFKQLLRAHKAGYSFIFSY